MEQAENGSGAKIINERLLSSVYHCGNAHPTQQPCPGSQLGLTKSLNDRETVMENRNSWIKLSAL